MSLRHTLQFLVAVVVASVALALGSAAGAAPNPDYTAPASASVVNNPGPQPVRRSSVGVEDVAAAPGRQQLPITGSDVAQLALVGGVLVAVGAVTMVVRRRSTTA